MGLSHLPNVFPFLANPCPGHWHSRYIFQAQVLLVGRQDQEIDYCPAHVQLRICCFESMEHSTHHEFVCHAHCPHFGQAACGIRERHSAAVAYSSLLWSIHQQSPRRTHFVPSLRIHNWPERRSRSALDESIYRLDYCPGLHLT